MLTCIDDVVHQALAADKGVVMAKIDVQQVYCHVSVHAGNQGILGMEEHAGRVFVNRILPFRPQMFTALIDAI